ncbi:DUF3857 domain-containing protein [Flavicella sediminum]|uniref:DUF3857 domain-containing protein n=1 Tax=Flavicella sediminum TaxID=2585141 RepID=UPI00111F5A5F|nr:DUF3857 domain-containing protein [Flavicella sediminum]
MKKITTILLCTLFLFSSNSNSQEAKFGKVTKEELKETKHPLDSTADAAYLQRTKKIYYQFNGSQGWSLITDVYVKLKIYSEEGFKHAQEKINLYQHGGKKEKTTSIKAYTYLLKNGNLEKQKLSKDQIFTEETSDNYSLKKFTMPALKTGAIVEWKYSIRSPFFWYINKQNLQYDIPINKLKTKIYIPEYFVFKQHTKGYLPIQLAHERKNKTNFFENVYTINSQDVPALKKEPFVSNLNNYRSSIDFELSYTDFPNTVREHYSTNWDDICKDIYKSSKFGTELNKHNYFNDDLLALKLTDKSEAQKVTSIFEFVKQKLNWDKTSSKYTKYGVKKAYETGVGNSADINLILTAMLREAGLLARPIISSTRDYGIPLFPTQKGLNYVIASVKLANGNYILLDATEKFSSPNSLPLRVMNWNGRLITKDGRTLSMPLKSKIFSKESQLLSINIDSNFHASGFLRSSVFNLSALNYRNKNNNLTEEKQIASLEKKLDIEIHNFKTTNAHAYHKPLTRLIQFESDEFVEQINNKYYINPEFFLQDKISPFKNESRVFPIDYGTPWEEKFSIQITLPQGYVIESIPTPLGIALPDNLGSFKYNITNTGNKLSLNVTSKINTDLILPEYYPHLKEYYKTLIAKQSEKIVLVKKQTSAI